AIDFQKATGNDEFALSSASSSRRSVDHFTAGECASWHNHPISHHDRFGQTQREEGAALRSRRAERFGEF
ncbi:MAG: hypothetical protein ACREH4_07670, partial [Vitreimonas sp.]